MLKLRVDLKFFLVFIIALFLKIIHGGYVINLLCYLQIIVLAISVINIIVNYITIELDVKKLKYITTVNNNFKLAVDIKNNGPLAGNFVIVENSTINKLIEKYNGEVVTIGGRSNKKLKYDIIFKQRGIYDLGTYNVEFSDLFSIISIKKTFKKDCMLKVYPKTININKYIGNGNNVIYDSESSMGYRESSHSVKDIRKYIPGDSLKKINWKLTAKTNQFMVKNYENTDGNEINIFLDMSKSNYQKDKYGEMEETLIDIAASLVQYANKNNVDVNLWCNNKEGAHHRFNHENAEDPFEFFIEKKSDGNISFENFVRNQIGSISVSNMVTIIAIRRDEEMNRIEKYIQDLKCIPNIICLKENICKNSTLIYELDEMVEGGR